MDITIKRRRRSTSITLRVLPGGTVTVNAPFWIPNFAIQEFVSHQATWLAGKIAHMRTIPVPKSKSQTKAEHQSLRPQALTIVQDRLTHFNRFYNYKYTRITIRNQVSRWGSCSHTGNLSFNYRIALLEPELRDYIIVHELCHLQEPNHGPRFWSLVSHTFPNHKQLRKTLRTKHLNLL